MSTNAQSPKAVVEVGAADLQGPGVVFCPNPKQALWSNHPRVYIDVVATGEGKWFTQPPGSRREP